MELPLQKFNGLNFHTWQLKTRMRLMYEGLWVNGESGEPAEPGEPGEPADNDKAKAIIGLALSDSYIQFIELDKTAKEIWDRLNTLFGKGTTAKILLKSQLYSLKMQDTTSLSSHINYLKSLRSQIAEAGDQISDEEFLAIMLNSLSPKFNNVVFTLSQLPAPTPPPTPAELLEKRIETLLAEEKRMNT